MPLIRAHLLGDPVVLVDGVPAPPELLWRKHLALCVLLWSHPRELLSRDWLMHQLWGAKTESSARHSLNEALRVLRRSLGADAISSEPAGVRWNGQVDLDTEEFARRWKERDPGVLDLVRGDFCASLTVAGESAFDDWIEAERRHWRSRILGAFAAVANRTLDSGATDDAVALCRRALRLDPLNEEVHGTLIRAHWLAGNRAAAIDQGSNLVARLRSEIGADPGASTMTLLRDISRGRMAPLPGDTPDVRSRRPPLVGRRDELETLVREWRHHAGGHQVLLVDGQPGSGRSRMLQEVMERAMLDRATVLAVRTLPSDAADPDAVLLAVAAALADAPGAPAAPPESIATLAALVPRWRELHPSAARPVAAMALSQATSAVLHAAAGERRVVLAVDDIEWVGEAGLDAVLNLFRVIPDADITLVVVLNSHVATAATDHLRQQAGRDDRPGNLVKLGPLDIDDMRTMVASRFPGWEHQDSDRLARRLMTESAGLPAIAVELLGAIERGMQLEDDVRWPAPDRTLDATFPGDVPPSLAAAIRMAFNAVPGDGRDVLKVAAVAPEPFTAAVLQRALPGMPHLEPVLDRLEWENWIVADARGYSFAARAVRRTIASDMLTPGARRRIEASLAP